MIEDVTYAAAFLAGLASFFSYCVLPLIPSYFCFITGMSLDELTAASQTAVRRKIIGSTLAFVLGFSAVFIAMGVLVSMMGELLSSYKAAIRIIGGVLIIIFGLHLTHIVRIPFLDYEKRFHLRKKPIHVFGAFIVGMAFAAGWTPCFGPLLGTVLTLAQNEGTVEKGISLLAIYSAGMALPFILLSIFINFLLVFIKKTSKALRYINPAAGILLIIIGILLAADKLTWLTNLANY